MTSTPFHEIVQIAPDPETLARAAAEVLEERARRADTYEARQELDTADLDEKLAWLLDCVEMSAKAALRSRMLVHHDLSKDPDEDDEPGAPLRFEHELALSTLAYMSGISSVAMVVFAMIEPLLSPDNPSYARVQSLLDDMKNAGEVYHGDRETIDAMREARTKARQ